MFIISSLHGCMFRLQMEGKIQMVYVGVHNYVVKTISLGLDLLTCSSLFSLSLNGRSNNIPKGGHFQVTFTCSIKLPRRV